MPVFRRVLFLVVIVLGLGGVIGWGLVHFGPRLSRFWPGNRMARRIHPEKPKPIEPKPIVDESPQTASMPLEKALEAWDFRNDLKALSGCEVILQTRLRRGCYEDLDALAETYRRNKSRFPGGAWRLVHFYDSISEYPGGDGAPDADWQGHLKRFQEWIAQRPQSRTARIAYAEALVEYAWKARGSGWASGVTDEGWKLFRERLQAARQALEKLPSVREEDPMRFRVMQTVALGQGWERKEYDALFARATACEPAFTAYYTAKAYDLLPRWHGEEGEWEAFAKSAADAVGGPDGDALYFRIAEAQSRYYKWKEFAANRKVSWPRMKSGYKTITARWGTNANLENRYCLLASYACDRPEALAASQRVGENWDEEVWREKANFEDVRDWIHCRGKYAGRH